MNTPNSDQSGHNREQGRFVRSAKWQDIVEKVDELRAFIGRLRGTYTDRGLATMLKLSQATVTDFARGKTVPERRTMKKFAKLYLFFHPFLGYLEKRKVPERKVLPLLRSVLPEGEQAAMEYVDALIRAGEASGTLPQSPEGLREWLTFLIEAEYDVEHQLKEYERKRRPKANSDSTPKRRQKKRPPTDGKKQ